ncbi:DegT/DnrJ/EryC1/StrS aminotransferase family protein [Rubellicoccus peritrichatus]|uniref:DegT/DnrJ/EryC1/StrS aminotransferase family protein n=1 Tax=Rubellicoccus peritrichatus TaxID=3080537 RepID=A0AAQ3LBN9_9BACT|nr:DegT/DnrJ/EryC1/StrS aminotransferase family protein [Puniceicoccus sp. CR14]WOO40915.1 DegT/DnrJ/EryC1/StrS aminotransferase family protein [Puniceicoccus sp. CR14]
MSDEPFLPFAKPSISPEAIAEVVACLESGWITTGPRTKKFESMLAEYLGSSVAQCCSSATAGLHMVLLGLDLKPGDEVITSSMTFVATLNTIVLAGGKPVLVDVDPATYNLDLAAVEAAVTERTRAIIPVHFAGLSVDLDRLYGFALKKELRVIEDAAHAIGSEYKGRKIGSFGDTQVFSFHPNKNMTTGEGGCITTRDEALRRRVEQLRFHGIDREAWARFGKQGSPHYDIATAGFKYNMMDMQAALGLHQLPALDGFIARRTEFAKRYFELLDDVDALILPNPQSVPYDALHAWHLFAPVLDAEKAGMDRDTLIAKLKEHNIGTGIHYRAPHLSDYYENEWGFRRGMFPQAERISDGILSLPLFPTMTEGEQDRVVAAIRAVLG